MDSSIKKSVSTYGLITASRLLKDYHLDLSEAEVTEALTNSYCFYYQLLKIPLKNILNGIVVQQAYDYQVYAQKLMVDYLLSGETVKNDTFPGQELRQNLEARQAQLQQLNQTFNEQEIFHKNLIADSQKYLLKYIHHWQQQFDQAVQQLSADISLQEAENLLKKLLLQSNMVKKETIFKDLLPSTDAALLPSVLQLARALTQDLIKLEDSDRSTIEQYQQQIHQFLINICTYRSHFYQFIIDTVELLKQLPDYQIDLVQLEQNLESIIFDNTLGNIE